MIKVSNPPDKTPLRPRLAVEEHRWVRRGLTGLVTGLVLILLVLPLCVVFAEALRKGASVYFATFQDDATRHAIKLTLLVAGIVVPLNTLFGVAIAWLLTHYRFRGRRAFLLLIDLPLSVSPVISGLMYVLLFGSQGPLVELLRRFDLKIVYAAPGIVLATLFVTLPLVARNVMPVMEAVGKAEEEAAMTLGARGWQLFWHVTLPKIRWGVINGVILCNARAMGEFGAVSVVSGHIRGLTNTIPLQVEILYNEYAFSAAFALASLLSLLAIVTLVVKEVEARRSAGG